MENHTNDDSLIDDKYFDSPFADYTASPPAGSNDQLYQAIRYYVNQVVIPTVLALGAVGNVVVLRRLTIARRQRLSPGVFLSSATSQRAGQIQGRDAGPWRPKPSERSSLVGLTALSISDLLFCIVGIPAAVLTPGVSSEIRYLYNVCSIPLHNLFLFSSTWIAALVASERFFVIHSPLRARMCLKVRHSLTVTVIIFATAALVSLPLFFRNTVVTVDCPLGRCQVLQTSWLFRDGTFRTAYRVVWTVLGTFVPLTLLCVASAGLVAVLYRSRKAAVASPRRYPCTRVTVTVTSLVLTFIVLVCPSMLLEVAEPLHQRGSIDDDSSPAGRGYLLAVVFTNLTQAILFSANFALYSGCAFTSQRTRLSSSTCHISLVDPSRTATARHAANQLR